MSKRKDSIALFEVISKTKQEGTEPKTAVPEWAGRDATGRTEPPVGPKAEGEAAAGEAPAPGQTPAPADPAAHEPPPARRSIFDIAPSSERAIVRDAGRMKVSLSYLHWGGVAAGLVALLIVTFLVGRASVGGGPGPIPSIGSPAGGGSPGGKVDPGATKGGTQTPVAANRQRQVGKYYLVIQGNLTSKEEGDRISEFCFTQGEPSTVARYKQGSMSDKLFVWSMTPLDSPDGEAAQAHAKKIEEMGKKYFATHKTYDFRQRGRDSKFQPTFLQYNG